MITKIKLLLIIILLLAFSLIGEIIYINYKEDFDISKKQNFIELTAMPDLAISTETIYIRNSSLADIFSIYKDDPTLVEYFPSTFVYNIEIKE